MVQALQALQRQPNAAQYFQQLMLQQQISSAQLHNLAAVQQVTMKYCKNKLYKKKKDKPFPPPVSLFFSFQGHACSRASVYYSQQQHAPGSNYCRCLLWFFFKCRAVFNNGFIKTDRTSSSAQVNLSTTSAGGTMTSPRPHGPATSATTTALNQSVLLGGNSAGQGQMYLRVSVARFSIQLSVFELFLLGNIYM